MEDLTDGYRYRIGLIQNLTYDDADSNCSQSTLKSLIEATIASSKASDVSAIDGHHGLPGGLVATVRRNAGSSWFRHLVQTSNFTESGRLPDFVELSGCTADLRQVT